MAVVKANYVKRGKQERAGAKANIRYIRTTEDKTEPQSPDSFLAAMEQWRELMPTG
jgi:hypothetical protein